MRRAPWPLACLVIAGLMAAPTASAIEVAARDALTGAPLTATIEYLDGARIHAIEVDGRLRSILEPNRRIDALVRAEGHHDLALSLGPDATPMTVLLDPIEEPAAFMRLAARVSGLHTARWLQGYVRRVSDAAPITDASVSFESRSTRTGADGYFELELAPFRAGDTHRSTLRVHADGIGTHVRDGLVPTPGIQRLLIALGAGIAASSSNTVGAFDRGARAVGDDGVSATPLPRTESPAGPLLAPPMTPPETIRVGFADAACTQTCCTAACTHTCILPLETYVRRGLDSEWIASWNTQSLRAGSIAYRSYGAWRVAHPIRSNFDICSSACCQVNDANTSSSTDSAIARTPGLMLSRNGTEAASAEYSAENNSWIDPNSTLSCSNGDLSCGNGFAGSPSASWPCLADPVSAGKSCFGHGRGMSQWGTQRWAIKSGDPQRWPWIVDHYYNDNDNQTGAGSGLRTAVLTSPLALTNVSPKPATLAPGSPFQIAAIATNNAGASHAHLLIGASLYRSGVGYINDPMNDSALVLASGAHTIGRTFSVPGATPIGSYDLLLSLYLDVDENGIISSTDLALAMARINGAVQIQVTPAFEGFADGFEDAAPRP